MTCCDIRIIDLEFYLCYTGTERKLPLDTITIMLFFLYISYSFHNTNIAQSMQFFLSLMYGDLCICSFLFQNFLFSSKEENSPLKVIDFGLSDFVKPGWSNLVT